MASQKHLLDRTSFVIPWLRLHTPSAGDLGSIPGQGNRTHMLQLRVLTLQPKKKNLMSFSEDQRSPKLQLRLSPGK